MGAMTDPSINVGDDEEKLADGEAESVDGEQLQAGRLGSRAQNHVHPKQSHGVHLPRMKHMTDQTTDAREHQGKGADGVAGSVDPGMSHARRAEERVGTSPGQTHIRRGTSTGIFRGDSGGIFRGLSGGIHLPSLQSLTFEMTRLPEEDAGVQRHFTVTKEVGTPPESPLAGATTSRDIGDVPTSPPPRIKSKMRKYLTPVGACSFGFRLSETVLSLIAIVVMCSDSRYVGAEFGTLKFNHFQAYRYLVAVNIIVFVYATVQFIQLAITVILGMSFIPSIMISTWMTFGFDQLFAYFLLSASTSAATVANMSYTGEMGIHLCSRFTLDTFCAQADAAVTISFFAFLAMLSSTALAVYRIGVLLTEW